MKSPLQITQTPRYLLSMVRRMSTTPMAPADFQRAYAWGKKDVLDLCDSIVSGYPLGSFFIWEISADQAAGRTKPRLGPLELDLADLTPADEVEVVLDGQNRLATIAWLARDANDLSSELVDKELVGQEQLVWGSKRSLVAYDLGRKCFDFFCASELDQDYRVPSWILLGETKINPFLREKFRGPWATLTESEKDQIVVDVDELRQRFSSAMVIVTALHGASAIQARDAFLKICRTGVPMAEDDFMAAANWQEPIFGEQDT